MSEKESNFIRLNVTQKPYLSSLDVWALAVGASVGWGSLIVTANTYLMKAGPAGSIIGLIVGALLGWKRYQKFIQK